MSVATISRVLNKQAGVAPETRESVLRVIQQQGFTTNPTARGLAGARTGLRQRDAADDRRVVLRESDRERRRHPRRARPAGGHLPDAARARPGGRAAQPADARDDGGGDPDPPVGIERGAGSARRPRLPRRRARPEAAARRRDSVRLGVERAGRAGRDAASAQARSSPDRRHHRAARLDRDRGAAARLSRRPRRGRGDARGGHRDRVGLQPRGRLCLRAQALRRQAPAHGSVRVQRQPRRRRDAGRAGAGPAASPRTSR